MDPKPISTRLPLRGLLAGRFAIPRNDLLRDGTIAARPLPTHALGPSASPQIVQEHLNVNEGCALVETSSKREEPLLSLGSEAGVVERIPILV
jgi:hypothetical protein